MTLTADRLSESVKMKKILEFQKRYPTKEEKTKALKAMTNEQIDALIADCTNVQGKIWYKSYKK